MRILVVDDHELVRRGIASILAADPAITVCGEAVDGLDAIEKSKVLRPDVVIMDITMPNMNGLQATQEIRRRLPETEIVIVSQHEGPEIIRQALNAGALAYVVKSAISTTLLAALAKCGKQKTVADGAAQAPPTAEGEWLISESPSLRSVIDLLPMAAYAVRAPHGVIAWFNSRAAELWGRVPNVGDTDERFCGSYKLFHPDGRYMAHSDTPVALALNTGVSVHRQEVVIARPDGSRVTVSVHIDPIRDKDGAIVGVVNFFDDITERKQAERATGFLASLIDSSGDAIISKNLDGIIKTWNKGAERIFGYAPEEAIGKHITLIIPPERRYEEATILEKLKRGERVDHFETIRVRKDGTRLDISATISPVKDAAGVVIGASKIARDITHRKQAEEELRTNEEKLRALADALDSEVRLRTQELDRRNADVLQQSEQLRELSSRLLQTQDQERRRIARDLHDSAGQIVAALSMNLSSISHQMEQNPALVGTVRDSQELVQQLNREIRTLSYLLHPPLLDETGLAEAIRWYITGFAERSGLKVQLDIPHDFGRLSGDAELTMFRIAQECLTNIHRHSGSKSALIKVSRDAGNAYLEIRDEGKGISAQTLDKLQGKRSGVGLTGMRERVRYLNGVMDIQSNGKGTTVLVTLPTSLADTPKLEFTTASTASV